MGIIVTPPGPGSLTVDAVTGNQVVELPPNTPQSSTAAANTAVTVTVAGVAGSRIRITAVSFSYAGVTTTGLLTITVNAVVILQLTPPSAGIYTVPLPDGGIVCAAGFSAVCVLAAGGAASVGSLNVASFLGS